MQQPLRSWINNQKIPILVGLVLCCLYLYTFAFKAYFEIHLETYTTKGTFFKVYWAGENEDYQESKSNKLRIRSKGNYHIQLFLAGLGDIRKLRIDPIEYKDKVKIKSLVIEQDGFEAIHLKPQDLGQLTPLSDIDTMSPTEDGLLLTMDGKDGNVEWNISPQKTDSIPWTHLFNIVLILFGCLALRSVISTLSFNNRYIPIGMAIASVLIAVMATITTMNVHPDERVHVEAVKYYGNHYLPPAIDSPEIANSFSDYGRSRISSYELYYPFAGYFTRLLKPLHLSELLNIRIFGIAVFLALLLAAVSRAEFRFLALPLIISPQIWYLFCYPNSDSFGLATSLLMAFQVAVPNSTFNYFLNHTTPRYYLLSILGFGFLAGIILLSKVNFYFFILFLGLYVFWRLFNGHYTNPKILFSRLAMIAIVAVSMYGGRYALDVAANGPNPATKNQAQIEATAKPRYKPSTPLEDKYAFLQLRDRGEPLDAIMLNFRWGGITFASSFGSYGFTQYFGTDGYFNAVKLLITLLLGAFIFYALVRGPTQIHGLILITTISIGLMVAASIWVSWSMNFQPQGRYLLPVLPMLSIVCYHLKDYINQKVIFFLASGLFIMSVYSFVFIGLHQIAKTSFEIGGI